MAGKQVHRISIMTAVGCGNLGDEYILRSEYMYLRRHFPDARITIFTYAREAMLEYDFGAKTEFVSYFPNSIRKYPFRNIWYGLKQILAIAKSDLLILGGGGIFYDNEGGDFLRLLRTWSIRVEIARFFRVPLFFWSISLEIKNPLHLAKIRSIFSGSNTTITVRDNESREKLESIGISSRLLYDPVFLMNFEKTKPKVKRRKVVGIAIRGGFIHNEGENIRFLKTFLEARGYDVIFLSHSFHEDTRKNDRFTVEEIFRGERVSVKQSLEETERAYSEIDFMIAMRLHAGIVSAVSGIPFLMVSYGPKTDGFIEVLREGVANGDMLFPMIQARDFHERVLKERFSSLEQEENTIKFALIQKCDMIREYTLGSLNHFFHGLE